MEIKWEKMDYIAFILLGMLTIFYGNKQLQQLVAGLYIALAIWYVYTIIYEVKRYRQQEKSRPNQLCEFVGVNSKKKVLNLHLGEESTEIKFDITNPQTVLDYIKKEINWE